MIAAVARLSKYRIGLPWEGQRALGEKALQMPMHYKNGV